MQQKNNLGGFVLLRLCRAAGYLKCASSSETIRGIDMAKAKKKETKSKSTAPGAAPLVDTNLAAEAAARRVKAGFGPARTTSNLPVTETASFKHMKESLSKPTAGLEGILDKTSGPAQRQPTTPFHGGKQTGRNQVFGADVNRTGVPRRTGGG